MPFSTHQNHHHHCTSTFKTLHHHPAPPPHLLPNLPDHIMDAPLSLPAVHSHKIHSEQCSSVRVITIAASLPIVWSLVRRFDNPQAYKKFLKSCSIIYGDGETIGSLREVHLVSGMPATLSIERLEILDYENYVISYSIVGGDQRLVNYRSITTLHSTADGRGTIVVESYIVDVPTGNTKDETCAFVDTFVRFNLESLAQIVEQKVSFSRSKHWE